MGLADLPDKDGPRVGLEQRVRNTLEEKGFKVRKRRERGISGNTWELDAIAYDDEDTPIAFFEVKDIGDDADNRTYRNHMVRAVAELTDFRDEDIPGAVVVPRKRDFGNKDWDDMFESIGCRLISEDEIDEFLSELDSE